MSCSPSLALQDASARRGSGAPLRSSGTACAWGPTRRTDEASSPRGSNSSPALAGEAGRDWHALYLDEETGGGLEGGPERRLLAGSNRSPALLWLCVVGQVTWPLGPSASSFVQREEER